MRFRVTADIDPEIMERRTPRADHILAVQAAKDTEPFVPALTKSLSDRTKVKDGNIIYPGPYARFLYEGKVMIDPQTGSPWAQAGATKVLTDRNLVFNKTVNSDAQDHWFEASKALNLKRWNKVYKRALHDKS